MSKTISLEDRIKRLNNVTEYADLSEDHGLLKVIPINASNLKRIQQALNHYLYCCLTAFYSTNTFKLSSKLLQQYEKEIHALPNITPNGLVLPKKEICAAYNALHRELALNFKHTDMGEHIESIQYPINVRLQNGTPNATLDSRPRASTKPHVDFWAGDPAAAILVFLSLLGDPEKVNIRFSHPQFFPESFLRTLDDYNMGKEIANHACEIPTKFHNGDWFIVDPFVIHQTIKNQPGLRVSIDFRFLPKQKLSSDWMGDRAREKYFIPFNEWCAIGINTMLVTEESIHDPVKKTPQDYTVGYPVDVRLMESETC